MKPCPHYEDVPAAYCGQCMGKLFIFIQARMGSARLPGKVLMDLGGKSMLERVVDAARRAAYGTVVVLTTYSEENDPIELECRRLDVACYRESQASENDVLRRFVHAASHYNADVIVRLTADCPLIDYRLIRRLIEEWAESPCEYREWTDYPKGIGDVEIMTYAALRTADSFAHDKEDREHVTPYLRRWQPKPNFSVDTLEDLERVRRRIERIEVTT